MPDIWSWMTRGFMPHGYCLRWDGPLLTVFIIGNLGITLAYFLIPAALRYFIGKRRDLPYAYMFKLFAAFILSCGLTHVAKVLTLYQPLYWLEAGLDLMTAGISLVTAALLFPLIPLALQLRSPKDLEVANRSLQNLTEELQKAKESLATQVDQRTAELLAATIKAQEAEAFFRELFGLLPQIAWTASVDGSIDHYNQHWYDYTGRTYEEMKGWGWESVHDPEYLPEVKAKWKEAIAAGSVFEMKFPLKGADGKFQWFLTRINPIRNEEGQVVRWVGINTNIQPEMDQAIALENKVRERTVELLAAKDLAEQALETKSRFLSTLSHEVRTPMTGVIGAVELINFSAKDKEMKELSGLALESCKRLLQILNDLLDASKLQAGALTIEHREFDLRTLVNDIVHLALPEADKKKIALKSTIEQGVPDSVCGDALRVRQILQNFLSNAIKFTAKGSVAVAVGIAKETSDGIVLKFSVTDSGIGISEVHWSKLFEPFVQAEDSTARIYGGTGLGLHICKTLTELMDGEIGFESKSGQGSTFWCTIPFRDNLCQRD
ncbi:hypothetical protein BH11CYA1_BH11CYA1_13980 [soil metagenome]